ncbi:MAG TPA: response regulator [Tepidisphaeraceae bacterium]|nr:response regulator [Tepidisphaeraceae bacterium]
MSDDGKVSILLVDDRPEKLLALEAVLEDLGQNVVRAYSGREALRQVLNREFAVILLDVNMPGMDGFETAALIRQRKSSQHVPIIFITAMGDEMHVARGYALGAVDYITSPVVPEVLRSKVAVFVDLFRKTEQVKRQAESLRRRASQHQKLAAASLVINGALSIERMLQTVTDVARDVIESHQAITLFIDPRSGQRPQKTEAFTSFSDKYAQWRGRPLNLDSVAQTVAAQSRTATRLTEEELHEHADWLIVREAEVPPIRGGMLAAPLTGRDGNNLGVVYLSDRAEGPYFTAADEAVLVQLAQMASIAIENTLYAEEREANRIKDEFLSTLSHELRTPLNAILGWTQLLRMGKPSEAELTRGLDVIERNVRAQTRLIEDLLDVSRITTGKLRLSVRPMSLAPVIEAAADAVRPAADAKRITIEVGVSPLADQISGDPDRLQQVVWNLLSNAVKFTPVGGRITVALDRVAGQSQVRVTDTGQGIDPKFLPYVFDRFRQADASSTRHHGGLGIGLTIVRHIVELHGGTVEAESRGAGQGSTFRVNLPVSPVVLQEPPGGNGKLELSAARLRPAADEEEYPAAPAPVRAHDPQQKTPPPPAADGRLLDGVRVLVVDDAADALDIIAEILRRAGAQVETAESAREGLRTFGRVRPDVLVSDIAMPEEDGYALIQTVRALTPEDGGGVPAIALTAYAREEDRLRSLEAGFQAHLAKPVEPGALVTTVADLAPRPRDAAAPRLEAKAG